MDPYISHPVAFIPEPNCGRGTVSIIVSCVFTSLLVTFSSLHLDVPDGHASRRCYLALRKLKFSILALAVPEYIAFCAATELLAARRTKHEMQRSGLPRVALAQAFFVNMGGMAVRGKLGEIAPIREDNASLALLSDSFRALLPSGDDIARRSSSDFLGHALALLQAAYFLAQVFSRVALGYALSVPEILACAYILLAGITHACYAHKPRDIRTRLVVELDAPNVPVTRLRHWHAGGSVPTLTHAWPAWTLCVALFSGVPFAAAAWTYAFPSVLEANLFRVCCAGAIVLGIGAVPATKWEAARARGADETLPEDLVGVTCKVVYGAMRAAMVGVAMASLRRAEAGVYAKVGWTEYVAVMG